MVDQEMDKRFETAEFKYIIIQKENLPYRFTLDYKTNIFEIEFRYNSLYDYFSADLYRIEDDKPIPLMYGEKLMLDKLLFSHIRYKNIGIPPLTPHDFSGNSRRFCWDEVDNIYLVLED